MDILKLFVIILLLLAGFGDRCVEGVGVGAESSQG